MPLHIYQVPFSLDEAWQATLQYWQGAYACEIAETRDTPDGGRYLLVKKKFDVSGIIGFKIEMHFIPTIDGGVEVQIKSKARGAQLSQFGMLIKKWCQALGIPDQGVFGKSAAQSFKVVGIVCIVMIIAIFVILWI